MPRITDKLVGGLVSPETGNRVTWDDEVTGFGIRITKSGARSFVLRYIFDELMAVRLSNEYRYTIGAYPAWSVSAARAEAKAWRMKIDRGEGHPLAERNKRREDTKAAREAETYKEAVDDYIRREQIGRRRNKTAGQVRRGLLVDGAAWLNKPMASIAARDVRRLLDEIRDGDASATPPLKPRPYLSNRVHAYLSSFFSWCAEPGIEKITASPMIGMPRPFEGEMARNRVFDDSELKALWRAGDAIGGVVGPFLKTVMLTGKRSGALSAMRWDEFDASGIWTPPEDTRRRKQNKRLHPVPMSNLALRVIDGIRPSESASGSSPYVFPGRTKGTHLYAGSIARDKVRDASGIDDFIMHALRHTAETRMASLRIPPHIRDLLLDHAPARGAGADYDHHLYLDEMWEALELWANHIEGLVSADGVRVLR